MLRNIEIELARLSVGMYKRNGFTRIARKTQDIFEKRNLIPEIDIIPTEFWNRMPSMWSGAQRILETRYLWGERRMELPF